MLHNHSHMSWLLPKRKIFYYGIVCTHVPAFLCKRIFFSLCTYLFFLLLLGQNNVFTFCSCTFEQKSYRNICRSWENSQMKCQQTKVYCRKYLATELVMKWEGLINLKLNFPLTLFYYISKIACVPFSFRLPTIL